MKVLKTQPNGEKKAIYFEIGECTLNDFTNLKREKKDYFSERELLYILRTLVNNMK